MKSEKDREEQSSPIKTSEAENDFKQVVEVDGTPRHVKDIQPRKRSNQGWGIELVLPALEGQSHHTDKEEEISTARTQLHNKVESP